MSRILNAVRVAASWELASPRHWESLGMVPMEDGKREPEAVMLDLEDGRTVVYERKETRGSDDGKPDCARL